MSRGGARAGAGRPTYYGEPAGRRSVTLTDRHWEALRLLAVASDSTASQVLTALIEQAVSDAADSIRAANGEA